MFSGSRFCNLFLLLFSLVGSQNSNSAPIQQIKVAYLTQESKAPAALSNLDEFVKDKGWEGILLALNDNNTTGKFTGQHYSIDKKEVALGENSQSIFLNLLEEKYQLIIVNLAAQQLFEISELNNQRALLFDVATHTDKFRHKKCLKNVLHLLPSRAMRTDALAQYMRKKRWNKWFLVVGNTSEDVLYAQAIKRSAKKFAMKIVAEKKWEHNYDARRTAQSDVPVFTQVTDYDVLVVADEQGLFGEYLSYRSWLARPVIGTQGLHATAWHKTHEQWGAVQIQNRFKTLAGRPMLEADYGAYLAMRAIGEAVTRIKKTDAASIKSFLMSKKFKLQGYKGQALSFRSWNGQLRQPILLAAPKSLVATPPLKGYLHPKNELDTLGFDQPEVHCQ
jgi:ABC transporter substrate binding protein (PQQ-dependent alcohol dehydrogenase system)